MGDRAMSETGTFENAKSISANLVQGTLKCSCGQAKGGVASVQKGSVQSWTCGRCKKKVSVQIPR
jgi:hypothetical protein